MNSQKSLVSVVIPVYNTKKEYLLECFESVRLQTYRHVEVVVVDDGSRRDTADFIDMYTANLDNWTVVHKENDGLNMARKTGYDKSKGSYVTFVDSDDMVDYHFIEKLYELCIKYTVGYSVAEMSEFAEGEKPHVWGNPYDDLKPVERDNAVLVADQLVKDGSRPTKHRTYEGLVWGRLYRRELLDKIDWSFCNYRITEDEFFSIQIHTYTNGAAYLYEQLYFYRVAGSESLGQIVKSNAHNNKKIPYIQIAREVYTNFRELLDTNEIAYDKEDLLILYVKILLDRTRKLALSHELDEETIKEYKKQRKLFLNDIISSVKLKESWKLAAKVTYDNPKLGAIVGSIVEL